MATDTNAFGQTVGLPVSGTFPRPRPAHHALSGRYTTLEPIREVHAAALFDAFAEDPEGRGWTYMPLEPWTERAVADSFCRTQQASADPMFYTAMDEASVPSGVCSYLRIVPEIGSIEVGWIHFAPRLQRSRAATEAIYLLIAQAFDDLGYRRFEWKCDALNAPSRTAASRFGFTFEGVFRQASITKGRNRDTAWYSILDSEWPAIRARFEQWLDPANFNTSGQQILRMQDCGAD